MSKRKKRRAPVPEPEVQPVVKRSTRSLADWEIKRAQAPDRAHTSRRVCPACKRPLAEDGRTPTDAALSIADEFLISFVQLHAGENQNWDLRDVVLNWLDHTGPLNNSCLEIALTRLALEYPLLGALLAAQLRGDSFRGIADELGISDPTVATMVTRLHNVLVELLRQAQNA